MMSQLLQRVDVVRVLQRGFVLRRLPGALPPALRGGEEHRLDMREIALLAACAASGPSPPCRANLQIRLLQLSASYFNIPEVLAFTTASPISAVPTLRRAWRRKCPAVRSPAPAPS